MAKVARQAPRRDSTVLTTQLNCWDAAPLARAPLKEGQKIHRKSVPT
jgi:hypothetical protein